MTYIKKNLIVLIMAVTGALGGLLYWKFVGCQSGTCPIKSVWYWSTLYGVLIGGLAGSIIKDLIIKIATKRKADNISEK